MREKEIAGVVAEGELRPALREHFLELCIPVFSSKNVPVQMINKMPFVRPEDVMAALCCLGGGDESIVWPGCRRSGWRAFSRSTGWRERRRRRESRSLCEL